MRRGSLRICSLISTNFIVWIDGVECQWFLKLITIVLDKDRAFLFEECLVVAAHFPYLTIAFLSNGLQHLDRLTHKAEDEGEDHLGGAGTAYVHIHHHYCVLLENVVLLVDETE